MTTTAEDLRWDLSPYFPSFDGPEYRQFVETYRRDIEELLDAWPRLGPLTAQTKDAWVDALLRLEALGVRGSHLGSYLSCLSSADTESEPIQEAYAGLTALRAQQSKIWVLAQSGFKQAGDADFQALLDDPRLKECEYYLSRLRQEAKWTMPEALELLASDLSVDGITAWGRLYDQVSGNLKFDMPDGRRVPMAEKNSLLEHRDPAVRKATLERSNAAWAGVEDVTAAALNAIAGTRLTLDRRRGIPHFLDVALFDAAITRRTLDTLLDVVARHRDIPRRYLKLKAKLLGVERLGFQDVACPLPVKVDDSLTWEQARQRVLDAFGRSYPALRDFARMALEQRWVDSEPRTGKRQGGFCTSSYMIRQSRVFMTFHGTSGGVQTLAHELGHAFHNWVMRDLRAWARPYPMTLAESASTFGETLVTDALLADPQATPQQKAVVLNTRLEDSQAYLLNVPMRFIFEHAFYEERARGPVRVSRLKELMLKAEEECYGDSVDPATLDPYFWASKLHFYITGVRFYNFPYIFGYLFSMGLFARFKQEGPAFFEQYEKLLRLTGSDTAEGVARRALGGDLEKPDYWEDSLKLVAQDLQQLEDIVHKL